MFCKNCGNKIKEGNSFCESCGTPTKNEQRQNEPQKNLEGFEKKAWFRSLKVIYIIAYVFVVGAIFIVGFSAMPQRTLNQDLTTIKCTNGIVYPISKNGIYAYDNTLSTQNDEDARILCQYDTTNYFGSYSNQYIAPNYTFSPVYTEPDYSAWFFEFIIGLFIGWIILKIIKIGTLYIITGLKPQWSKELRKLA